MDFSVVFYALLVGFLPAFIWLWFWLREDNLHPEPRFVLAASFVAGAIVVFFAVLLENLVKDVILDNTARYIAWAAIEELVKIGAVAFIAFRAHSLDEPIDAMIYCITVALGFSALENAFFVFSPLALGELSTSLVLGNYRFIGSTLVHTVCSGLIGFMIGISYYKGILTKTIYTVTGIILATALHSAFNLAIINQSAMTILGVFGWVWFATVILIILFEEVKAVRPQNQ